MRLVAALWPFWRLRFHAGEGRGWLERALALGERVEPKLRAKVLLGTGTLAWVQCNYETAQARI